MKILKAKIKANSNKAAYGRNYLGKSVWLTIIDFKTKGDVNYCVNAVKRIANDGTPVYFRLWLANSEVIIRKFDDGQLKIQFDEQ